MFLFVPLRVEQAAVDRMPWVSIGIAAACVLAFAATWVAPKHPEGASHEQVVKVLEHWQKHPTVVLPERFTERFLRPHALDRLEGARKKAADSQRPALRTPPGDAQRELEELVDAAVASSDHSSLRRLSLIPARGVFQIGWLTHMFLHFGWLHILGNLLFFYLVGPLLEDLWGRRFFLGFYILGGLLAALAHFSLDRHSGAMMAGASGAIAACMGAFAYRCASREIRFWYFLFFFFRFKTGTFVIPAWFWGLCWFGSEVFSFLLGASHGVAVMAHIGGFAFGFLTALAIARSGYEARHIAPAVERATVYQQHEGHDRAQHALERGDWDAAAQAYRDVLADRPDDLLALAGLARTAPGPESMARIEEILVSRLRNGDTPGAWRLVLDMQGGFDPDLLTPRAAFLLAGAASAAPVELRDLLSRLDRRAGAAGGVAGAKAHLRAAVRMREAGHTVAALRELDEARSMAGLPAEILERIEAEATKLAPAAPESAAGPAEPAAEGALWTPPSGVLPSRPSAQSSRMATTSAAFGAAAPPGKPATNAAAGATAAAPGAERPTVAQAREPSSAQAVRILSCRVLSLTECILEIESTKGQLRQLDLRNVVAIGSGIVPVPEKKATMIVTDLILTFGGGGRPPAAVRIEGTQLGLATLYPGVAMKDAYAKFVHCLLDRSGASALPDRAALEAGSYPRFASTAEMNQALYGAGRG